jgi:lipid-binding SYLF domain-containing protein
MLTTQKYRVRILKILEEASKPTDVENIRVQAKIGNWMTAKAILMELALEGSVIAEKTSKSWIFRPTSEHINLVPKRSDRQT